MTILLKKLTQKKKIIGRKKLLLKEIYKRQILLKSSLFHSQDTNSISLELKSLTYFLSSSLCLLCLFQLSSQMKIDTNSTYKCEIFGTQVKCLFRILIILDISQFIHISRNFLEFLNLDKIQAAVELKSLRRCCLMRSRVEASSMEMEKNNVKKQINFKRTSYRKLVMTQSNDLHKNL